MSKERFEIFGKIIKDNEEEPNLLDNYLAAVRLNEFNEKIKDLQSQLDQANERLKDAIVPKFKIGQEVWYVYNKYQKFPFRCVIDKIVYDSSKNYKFRYDTSDELYIGIKEEDLFATEQEAQEKLKEMQGNE